MSRKLRTNIKTYKFHYHIEPNERAQTLLYDDSVKKQFIDNPITEGNLYGSITVLTDLSPGLQLTDRSTISKAPEPKPHGMLRRSNTFRVASAPKEFLAKSPHSHITRTKIRCSSLDAVLPGDLSLFYRYRHLAKNKKRTVRISSK